MQSVETSSSGVEESAKKKSKKIWWTEKLRTKKKKVSKPVLPPCIPDNIVSLDCEMVGCSEKGRISALGRCSIVNYNGEILYDSYVKPILPVTDHRTKWSGIKRKHLSNATPFSEAIKQIKKILSGKYIIGHDLQNDFSVLNFKPHGCLVLDTAKCHALRHLAGLPVAQRPSLKKLTGHILGKDIQSSSHCSVEDARAALMLYKAVKDNWHSKVNPYLNDSYWNVATTA